MTAVEVTRVHGCVSVCFSSPVATVAMLRELATRLKRMASEPSPRPVVLTSRHPRIYLAGADLAEIAALDGHSCVAYARLGRQAIESLQNHPTPTVAAVHGSCTGGGFDLVMACDAVMASPAASFSHPGVLRGLVTGWGGTVNLPARLGRPATRGAVLEGGRVALPELVETGVVVAVTDSPDTAAFDYARRLTSLHPKRLETWRSLRNRGVGTSLATLSTRGIID
jgi:enoyl-CoA hydratase